MGGLTLAGSHVVLVPLSMEHASALARASNGDRSTFGLTWVPDGLADAERYIAKALADQTAGTAVPFATTRAEDGEIVGSTRYMNIERWAWDSAGADPDAVEIGSTWLAPTVQRTPLNTEAKLLMLTHAFEVWQVQRVTLKTDARNERSRNAILRLGAHFDGILRANMPAYDGPWPRDSAFYSIVASEWPTVRSGLRAKLGKYGIPDGEEAGR
ncbi:MAG TPA: GNAT family protein [Acidimicrobiales bacterium]|nr:GNAT family protein [Acidimicrobiales bacterium]